MTDQPPGPQHLPPPHQSGRITQTQTLTCTPAGDQRVDEMAEIAGKPIWGEEVVIAIDHRLLQSGVDGTILQLPSRISKRQFFRQQS